MTHWIDPVQSSPSSLVERILLQRGYTDATAVNSFLNPDSYLPASPDTLPGLSIAADRILQSIRSADQICVWGDFDVDGQTSTTVLVQTLQALGARVNYHIPVRQNESHGVNIENLARIIAQGAKLVVTCDTGISANKAVNYAKSRGVDFIVTDHHDLPNELPKAVSIVNPKMLSTDHPLANLAGVGVAYKLAEELINRETPTQLQPEDLLDLVSLGLVADLAILRKDTRYLVQKGLSKLRSSNRLGLKMIMELAGLTPSNLTEEHIGFGIGPRLNALGRLGDANPAVELFTTLDPVRARVLATQLEGLNTERKLLCDQVYQAAESQLSAKPDLLTQPMIMLEHPQWPGGVIGIVASQLVERYRKPVLLFTSPEGQPMRGSARSVEGLNITAAISENQSLLLGFGGHPMAAGLSLDPENFPIFRRKLGKSIEELLGSTQQEEAKLQLDGWMNLEDANLDLADQFEKLAPFGPGNPKITLATRSLKLISATPLGKHKDHLKLTVVNEGGTSQQILWWGGGIEEPPSGIFDMAYTIRASDWKGTRQPQLELIDFRLQNPEIIEIESRKIDIIDFRNCENPYEILHSDKIDPMTLCWAEGEEKKRLNGFDRNELVPANSLIIWTSPPSRQELISALEKVKPEKVYVFAIDPLTDDPRLMLERLTGLVNYVINKKNGVTTTAQLAAASAQREIAIRIGLDWLVQNGIITTSTDENNNWLIKRGGIINTKEAEMLWDKLSKVNEESKAYRRIFRQQSNISFE